MKVLDKPNIVSSLNLLLKPNNVDLEEEMTNNRYDTYIMPNLSPTEGLWNELETQTLITSTSGKTIKSIPDNQLSKKVLERGLLLDNKMCVVIPNWEYENAWLSSIKERDNLHIIEAVCYHEDLHSEEISLTKSLFNKGFNITLVLYMISIVRSQRVIIVKSDDNCFNSSLIICGHLNIKPIILDLEGNILR